MVLNGNFKKQFQMNSRSLKTEKALPFESGAFETSSEVLIDRKLYRLLLS